MVAVIALGWLLSGVAASKCIVTTEDASSQMAACAAPVSGHISDATWELHIDDSDAGRLQTVTGFGAAWTDATVKVFNTLTQDDQETLLTDLFTDNGIDLKLMRHTIGQSDLTPSSIGEWSFDDNGGKPDPTLVNFNLTDPGRAMVSWLSRMYEKKQDVMLLGSPWSPPQWMKQNNNLRFELVDVWVSYMVKYLLAYKERGILVDAVTLQNEPLHSADSAWTMHMDKSYAGDYLTPMLQAAMQKAGLKTEIWAYDHNTDMPDYPQYVLDKNPAVTTVAWHCYTANPWPPLAAFHSKNPSVKMYMTECWTHLGTGEGFFDLPSFVQGPVQNYASGAMAWTLGGSTKYDVGYPGGCEQCSGIIQVDMAAKTYTKTRDYYTLGQFSKFVQRDAVYLNSTGSYDYPDGTGVQASAFLNPDGTRTLVVLNKIHSELHLQASFSKDSWHATIPARSVATWVISAAALLRPQQNEMRTTNNKMR